MFALRLALFGALLANTVHPNLLGERRRPEARSGAHGSGGDSGGQGRSAVVCDELAQLRKGRWQRAHAQATAGLVESL